MRRLGISRGEDLAASIRSAGVNVGLFSAKAL